MCTHVPASQPTCKLHVQCNHLGGGGGLRHYVNLFEKDDQNTQKPAPLNNADFLAQIVTLQSSIPYKTAAQHQSKMKSWHC